MEGGFPCLFLDGHGGGERVVATNDDSELVAADLDRREREALPHDLLLELLSGSKGRGPTEHDLRAGRVRRQSSARLPSLWRRRRGPGERNQSHNGGRHGGYPDYPH